MLSNMFPHNKNELFPTKIIGNNDTLVVQVYRYLIELIDNQLLRFGQQLPSEPDLARQLNVSRFSLREALLHLETDGYIIKRRGIGTFVNKPSTKNIQFGFEKLHSLTGNVLSTGSKPGTKELNIERITAGGVVRGKLGLKHDNTVIKIERLRTKDGIPFNYSVDYLNEKFVNANITKNNLGFSLYKFLEVHLGIFISYSKAEIAPYAADAFLSTKFSIPEGSLLTKVTQTHFLENHDPVLYSIEYFPKDLFTISIIRKR